MRYSSALMVILLALIGCDEPNSPAEPEPDPTGPCAAEGACEVNGVDLAVMTPRIIGADVDVVTGMPLVFPGDTVRIAYLVRNRGDETAPATAVLLCAICFDSDFPDSTRAIPALAPGAADSGVVSFVLPQIHYSDTLAVRVTLEWQTLVDDPLYVNDLAETRIYFAVPVPDILVEIPGGEIRTAESKLVRVRIENRSRFATISNRVLDFCLADFDASSCELDARDLRDIAPGGVLDTILTLTLPHDAWVPGNEDARQIDVVACVSGFRFMWCGDEVGRTRLLPNLDDFCDAQIVGTETLLSGVNDNDDCNLYHIGRADVWSMDLEPEAVVTATLTSVTGESPGLIAKSWRGDSMAEGSTTVSFSAGDATRYHIIVAGAGSYTLQLTRN